MGRCVMRDTEVFQILKRDISMVIPHYLMSSYLYYEEDCSYISDGFYDNMCKLILRKWDSLEHRHKYLIRPRCYGGGYRLLPSR